MQESIQTDQLNRAQVVHSDQLDEPIFNWLFDYANQSGFHFSEELSRLNDSIPQIDKIIWQPWRTGLKTETEDGCISSYSLIHHAIHYLVWRIHNENQFSFVNFSLLSESIAGTSSFYLSMHYLNMYGIEHPYVQRELVVFRKECERIGIDLLTLINEVRKDPFIHFKGACLEMFEMAMLLMNLTFEDASSEEMNREIEEKLSSFNYWAFISNFDFANFVAHTAAHAGRESCQADTQVCNKLMELLIDSNSFFELLQSIDAAKVD